MPDTYRQGGWWRDETFLDDLRRHVAERPEKAALVTRRADRGNAVRTIDYAELSRLTDRFAGALVELGLRRGDTFAAQLTDRWELAVMALGCLRAGVLFCPLMTVYRRRELEVMLRLTDTRVLVTMAEHEGTDLARLGTRLATELPSLNKVFVTDGAVTDGPAVDGAEPFDEFFFGTPWEVRHGAELDERELGPDDPCLVLFTSGTTSAPKGVLHSQNTLHAAVRGEAEVFGLDDTLVMTTTASYTHYTGVAQGVLMPVLLGGTALFHDAGDPGADLDLLADHHATFLYTAPPYLRPLMDEQRARPRDLA